MAGLKYSLGLILELKLSKVERHRKVKVNDIGSHSTLFFFFGWNLNGQPEQTILYLEIGRWESFRFMFLVLHWAVKAENRCLFFLAYISIS